MSMVKHWLEFDKDSRRKKFTNQRLGLLLAVMVILATTHVRPLLHLRSLALLGALVICILLQLRTETSSRPWRWWSVVYVLLLAGEIRSEIQYLGPTGMLWVLPSSGGVVLVSALFMTRQMDYMLVALGTWLIFLVFSSSLLVATTMELILVYVLAITGFGALMNHSYILGTLRLMKARDDFRLLSEIDPLTGLENRRKFIGRIDAITGTGSSLLLLLLDIDHFKKINDRWGHTVGDQALVQIADAIRSAPGVLAGARLGGEEFAVILVCSQVSEQLVTILAFCAHLANYDLPATLSGGAVRLGKEKNSMAALVAADVQLYAAKHAGRHRIFFNDEMVCEVSPRQYELS